jgi:hypothetical protein
LPGAEIIAPQIDFAFPMAMFAMHARGFRADHGYYPLFVSCLTAVSRSFVRIAAVMMGFLLVLG